jgi:hypothetical protein
MTESAFAGEPPLPAPSKWRRWVRIALVTVVGAPILVFALFTWSALAWSYSKGERAGIVQTFTRKGWLCKTWEGELAMTTVPGTAPVLWDFTVRNDSVASAISAVLGKEGRVVLSYEEHRGVPTRCFGETPYYVTGVRLVK